VVGSQLMNGETLTAEKAVELYEQHLADNFSEREIRHCLRGKDLACWCALDQPCRAKGSDPNLLARRVVDGLRR